MANCILEYADTYKQAIFPVTQQIAFHFWLTSIINCIKKDLRSADIMVTDEYP